ncbi:MAG TPA: helix-turn-helix domain-containing protein, partial [Candidatus Paceibacterota bacterium]
MTPDKKIISSTGKSMLSARKAAKILSCAPDYVSRLCREGRLDGVQDGGAWYVDPQSLRRFEAERETARIARAQMLAAERRDETVAYVYASKTPVGKAGHTLRTAITAAFAALGIASLFRIRYGSWLYRFGRKGFLFFVALFFAATAPLASYVQKTFFAPAPLPAPTMVFTLGPQQGPAAQNIVNNTYYPVVERIIGTSSAMGISEEYFAAQLTRIYDTISRHRGSGSTVDFSDLTAADIPALDYLPLAGGTLTGALTLLSLDTSATSTLAGITLESTDCSVFGNGGKLTTDSSGNVVCDDDSAGSGSGTPGGSNTQVQFNDGSSFGGNAGFTFNKTAGRLAVAYASTTGITADYASSTSLFAGTLTLNTALSVANGGTGSTTLGGLLSGNGTSIYSSATTTASCAGSVSCSAFTILGQSPVSISATDNTASTTLLSDSNTFSGTNTFSNTITGSITGNAGTVTNGVYTTTFNGLFDARFITDLAATTSIASI